MAGEAVMPTLSAAVLLLFVSACPSATAPAAAAKVPETSGVCPAVCAEQEAWKCQFAGLVRDEEPDELPRHWLSSMLNGADLPGVGSPGGIRGPPGMILFTSPSCPFSAEIEPAYTAVAAAFPQLLAWRVNTWHSRLNSRYGIRSTPSLLLLHNGTAPFMLRERTATALITKVANRTGLAPQRNGTTAGLCMSSPPMFLDPTSASAPQTLLLTFATAFVLLCSALDTAKRLAAQKHWARRGGVRRAIVKLASVVVKTTKILDEAPPPPAGDIAAGTKLRVCYGDDFEGRANWAIRIRQNPTLEKGSVLGHVHNGSVVTGEDFPCTLHALSMCTRAVCYDSHPEHADGYACVHLDLSYRAHKERVCTGPLRAGCESQPPHAYNTACVPVAPVMQGGPARTPNHKQW